MSIGGTLCILVFFVVWISLLTGDTEASHFRGGILSWRPLTEPYNNNTSALPLVQIFYRMAWRRSHSVGHFCTEDDIINRNLLAGEGSLSCSCTGLSQSLSYICTDFSTSEDWTTGINSFEYQPTTEYFEVWFTGCCWISLRNGRSSPQWNIGAVIDLRVRNDTGRINSSPTTTTMPIVRFQRECNNTIKIPVSDPDGDYVRCVWATRRCGGICSHLPGAVLNEQTCELVWNVNEFTSLGLYGVAIEIQDFASPLSTEYLSEISLQFLVDLVSSEESCLSQPVFIRPTRVAESCVGIPENTTYQEPIVARTGSEDVSLEDIDTVSPAGVIKSSVSPYPGGLPTDYHVNITWTPKTVGMEEILCFTPRDNVGSVGVQSCINLVTGTTPPQINPSSLEPPSGSLIFPRDVSFRCSFDQDIVRPTRPTYISVFDQNDLLVYQLDAQLSKQVVFLNGRRPMVIAFKVPGRVLVEKFTYSILMDSGVARSTTFCGVESTPITDTMFWSFTIRDVTPPTLTFDIVPSRSNENITITWTVNEPANCTCALSSPGGTSLVSCENSWEGENLREGFHSLHVTPTDAAGNVGTSRTTTWFVDKSPPLAEILTRPSNVSNGKVAVFSFDCQSVRDRCQFECGYNTSDLEPTFRPCTSPYRIVGLLNEVQYHFSLIATDDVGNTARAETVNWLVDTEAPVVLNVSAVSVPCGKSLHPNETGSPVVTDNQDANPTLSYTDDFEPGCSIIRIWNATDAAGNSANSVQSIAITNILSPRINISTFRLVPCSDDLDDLDILRSGEGKPTFHPCGRPLQISFSDDVTIKQCGSEFTRFWTVMDDCGNVVSAQQRIKIMEMVFPESPSNGEVNVDLRASLSWPSYPAAENHRVFVWRYEDDRPVEPIHETIHRTYRPSSPFPPSTRMLWQVEYKISGGSRRRRQSEITVILSPVWGFLTRIYPDLTVNEIVLPDFAFTGQPIEISWGVQNIGQMGVSPIFWRDSVYFGFTPEPTNLIFMRSEYVSRFVDPNDGYFITVSWTLPENLVGTFYVFVKTDDEYRLEDIDRTNNFVRSDGKVEVRLTPPPDLRVTSVTIPSTSFSGLEIEVRWSVENLGLGVTRNGVWYDQIYISSEGVLDNRNRRNPVTVRHDGILSPGSGYNGIVTFTVPARVFGVYQVIVETDLYDSVYENVFESNNDLISTNMSVILSPPADFIVSSLTVNSTRVQSGDTVSVVWEVRNAGNGFPDATFWYDSVVLTQNGKVFQTISNIFMSEKVSPSSSYSRSVIFTIRDIWTTGSYQIEVTADARNDVFEFEGEDNNMESQSIRIEQKVPDLVVSNATGVVNVDGMDMLPTVTLNWTVTNIGPGNTLGRITDTVQLIQCGGSCERTVLGRTITVNGLQAGMSYKIANKDFNIPSHARGNVTIQILTSYIHFERGSGSNVVDISLTVPCLSPHLTVMDLKVSTSLDESQISFTSGDNVHLTWNVYNDGNLTASENSGTALVSLIAQRNFIVSKVPLLTHLSPFDSARISSMVRLPFGVTGNVSFGVSYNLNNATCSPSLPVHVGPYIISPPPTPTLEVTNVGFDIEESGTPRTLFVTWRVRNVGNSMIQESLWFDEVSLFSERQEGSSRIKLGVFPSSGRMESGQSYTTSKILPIPQNIVGTVYVSVNSTFELIPGDPSALGMSHFQSTIPLILPKPELADLRVSNVTGIPFNVTFGSLVVVRFEVQNIGGATLSSSWTDSVSLVQSFFSQPVGTFTRAGSLDPQETYIATVVFKIPFALEGVSEIKVEIDTTLQEHESNRDNNVGVSNEFHLYEGPRGDLAVTISSNFVTLRSGEPFILQYNVTNIGAATLEKSWIDAVYFSQNAIIDPFDLRLASVSTETILVPGGTFQQKLELFLPFDLPVATFHLIVHVDSRGEISEQNEINNEDHTAFKVMAGVSSDLTVASVDFPASVTCGDQITVDWVIENLGLQRSTGYKCDTIYLSQDIEWNIKDFEVGRICSSFSLDGISSAPINVNMQSLQVQIPLVTAGEHYAIVRTRSNVRDSDLDNNVGVDDSVISVALPLLELNMPLTGQLELMERVAYRIPSVPSEETLVVTLGSTSEFGVNNLFVRFNDIASPNNFDAASQGKLSPNQTIIQAPTKQGDYYLLLQNNGMLDGSVSEYPLTYTLTAKIAQFEILEVEPKQAASLGTVTLAVEGTEFPENICAKLRNSVSGNELKAVKIYRFSSQRLFATFDLTNIAVGSFFDLVLNNKAYYFEAIEIVNGTQGAITIFVDNPTRLRPFEVGTVTVVIRNNGNTDVLAPLLSFSITDPGEARLINGGPAANWSPSHVFFGSPNEGPAGILSPGSIAMCTFEVRVKTAPANVEISISSLPSDDDSLPNLYVDNRDIYRPFMFSDERWNRIWDLFMETTGPTHQSFMKQISTILNYLSLTGGRAPLLKQAVNHQLELIDGFGKFSTVNVDMTDLQKLPSERGSLTLEYTREFDSRLSSRAVFGVFGKGWKSLWWNLKILSVNENSLTLEQDNNYFEFKRNSMDEEFTSSRGFVFLNETDYLYIDAIAVEGWLYAFNSSTLALKYIASFEDDTRLTFRCNEDNNPTHVKSSFGSYLKISYTVAGLVERVEAWDRRGNMYSSASYEYDITESELLSVTVDGSTVSYTYENDGAISSYTNANGVLASYSYDVYGILTGVSVQNSQGEVYAESVITDFRDGRVQVEDFPTNLTTDIIYGISGEPGYVHIRGEDAALRIIPDNVGGTTTLVGDHVVERREYDLSENLHRIYDGNDDVITVRKTSSASFSEYTDGNNNRYEYLFDEQTNTRSIIYPDGTNESRTFDESNFVVQGVTRKGVKSLFRVNEEGLTIQRINEGEDDVFFMYNDRGLVTEATNGVGTIKITYTALGAPRTVEYPDGVTIIYDYDYRGRQTAIRVHGSDGDYHAKYLYDDFNRVVSVTEDGSNLTIVTVEYDHRGPVSKRILPNGCQTSYKYRTGGSVLTEVLNTCGDSDVVSRFEYGYNERHLRKEINTTQGTWKVGYDGADQLRSWSDYEGNMVSITYDGAGNRQSMEVNGDVTTYAVNNLNQYKQIGDVKIINDQSGNIVEMQDVSDTLHYEFNVYNQMNASNANGEECHYTYNAMGALHEVACSGVKRKFYMDLFGEIGTNVLMEVAEDTTIKYYHAPGLGLLSYQEGDDFFFYNFDGMGSVTDIMNGSGVVISSFEYDPFGNIFKQVGKTDILFKFSGQFGVLYLREHGLYLTRTRLYNPKIGRFISPDIFGYEGSPRNLYIYANNNPFSFVDPEGTIPLILPVIPAIVNSALAVGVYGTSQLISCQEINYKDAAIAAISANVPFPTIFKGLRRFGGFLRNGLAKTPLKKIFSSGKIRTATGRIGKPVARSQRNQRYADEFVSNALGDVGSALASDTIDFNPQSTLVQSSIAGAVDAVITNSNVGRAVKIGFKLAESGLSGDCKTRLFENVKWLLDKFTEVSKKIIEFVQSLDPNDILGPSGYGAARFISLDFTLNYRIRFENMENATAPAQRVTIETSLDEDVDIATFRLGSLGFGNFSLEFSSQTAILQTTLQFDDGRGYVVRVTAGLDIVTRKATWVLQTLDPETGRAPVDPGIGFLPPNPENGTDGEGFVTYSVRPRGSAKTYDVIDAKARIVFDNNEPIDTTPIFNTIDRDPATVENIKVLHDVLSSGILAVSFESSDDGAGVKMTNIYSDEGGKMIFLKSAAPTESVVDLDLPSGASYKLVMVVEDNVGNMRPASEGAPSIDLFLPFAEVSCADVNNCSGAGNCTNNNLCQCIEGRYGNDCSQETPPKEPPVIGVSPIITAEDTPIQVPIIVKLVNPSPNDIIDLRLKDTESIFVSSNVGEREGDEFIIPIENAQNVILSPASDISGEFSVIVSATAKDDDIVSVSRVVKVPVFISPEADFPEVEIQQTCYQTSEGNASEIVTTISAVVSSGDDDHSEIVSVFIAESSDNSSYLASYSNVTMTTAQRSFNVTFPSEMAYDGEVRFTLIVSSVEVSNVSKVTTATSVTAFSCPDQETTSNLQTRAPPGSCKDQDSSCPKSAANRILYHGGLTQQIMLWEFVCVIWMKLFPHMVLVWWIFKFSV